MWNFHFFNEIQTWVGRREWLDNFAIFGAESLLFFMVLLVIIFAISMSSRRGWEMLIIGCTAMALGGWVIGPLIKTTTPQPRPYVLNETVTPLIVLPETEDWRSFPSGHTLSAFALAMGVMLYRFRLGLFLAFCAIVIGWARMHVGVHWPIDILAGAFGGIILATLCWLLASILQPRDMKLNRTTVD